MNDSTVAKSGQPSLSPDTHLLPSLVGHLCKCPCLEQKGRNTQLGWRKVDSILGLVLQLMLVSGVGPMGHTFLSYRGVHTGAKHKVM